MLPAALDAMRRAHSKTSEMSEISVHRAWDRDMERLDRAEVAVVEALQRLLAG